MIDVLVEKGSVVDDAVTLMIQTRFRRPEITAAGAQVCGAHSTTVTSRGVLTAAPRRSGSQWWTPVRCSSHEDTLQHRPQGGQQRQQQQRSQSNYQ